MKKTLLLIACVSILVMVGGLHSHVFAEEFLVNGQYLIKGEVVSETETEIVINTDEGQKTFPKSAIERTVEFVRQEPVAQKAGPKGTLVNSAKEFITVTFKKVIASIKPTHLKFVKWFDSTRLYRVLMNVPEFKKFKKDNYAGYVLAYYCIWLIIAAIAIRILKEVVILVLSLFGVEISRDRY